MSTRHRRQAGTGGSTRAAGLVEPMEPRVLLSAAHPHAKTPAVAAHWHASPIVVLASGDDAGTAPVAGGHRKAHGVKSHGGKSHGVESHGVRSHGGTARKLTSAISPDASSSPYGYTPAQVRGAYGLGNYDSGDVQFNGVDGEGAGQTIGIVDAYNDPTAQADLAAFTAQFGLPTATLTVVNQNGGGSLPGVDPNAEWELEESLDIEWAHAVAPDAKLLLVEANTDNGNDLYAAVREAAGYAGVSTVSLSWGGPEYGGVSNYDYDFTTPTGHAGVTFFAATGDSGAEVEYPAASANVVAVGGTALTVSGTAATGYTYGGESAWSGGGGGVSQYAPQPAYQAGVVPAATANGYRTVPDVSAVASNQTAVAIYDSYNFGTTTPWVAVGGTSLSTPVWAALTAITDQGRVAEGLPTLDSATGAQQTLTRLYQLPAADYHDITTGSNGYSAVAGYDLATGRGTPVPGTSVADLAGAAVVTGRIFDDLNGDGSYDGSDTPVAGTTVYLDLNNDGVLDNGDPSATTTSAGTYAFADEPAGGTVRVASPPAGYVAVPTGTSATIVYGATDTANLAFFPTTFATSAANAAYTLQTAAGGTADQVLLNGTLVGQVPIAALSSLTFNLTGAGDGLTVSTANGNPVPAGGLTLNGTAVSPATGATVGAALAVVGTSGNDAIAVSATVVTFGSTTITYPNGSVVSVDPGAGTDSLTVTGGHVTVPATAAGAGVVARTFSTLSVAAGATVAFGTPAAHADRAVVVVATLSVNGTVDLGGNDMVVRNGNLAQVDALLAGGTAGLVSSAAAAARVTSLGAILNQNAYGTSVFGGTAQPTFDGRATTTTDVLIKYTFFGDTNLDGIVNGSDYSRVDAGFNLHLTGWANGDFNYDGVVDGSDYTLVDNAFNVEGTTAM